MYTNATKSRQIEEIEEKNFEISEIKEFVGEDPNFFYFSAYLSTYRDIDLENDYFEPGAFDESIKQLHPDLLWMHDKKEVAGVFESLESDEKGLKVVGKLPKDDTLVSGRIIPQIKCGSVRGMSVGFRALEWDIDEKGCRQIKKAFLREGSLVSFPANQNARITEFKSYTYDDVKNIKTKREIERALRDSGAFSKKSASYLSSLFRLPDEEQQKSDNTDLSDSGADFSELVNEIKTFNNLIEELKNA